MPVYQLDPRLKIKRDAQVDFVSKEVYMEVGYDGIVSENSEPSGMKHYRKYYEDELENNKELFKRSPFYTAPIFRGQSRGIKHGFLSGLFGDGGVEGIKKQHVGDFKGHITIYNEQERKEARQQRATMIADLETTLNQLHLKKKNVEMEKLDPLALSLSEARHTLKRTLIDILGRDQYSEGNRGEGILEFLLQSSNEEQI